MNKKHLYSFVLVAIFLVVFLCGCQMNKNMNDPSEKSTIPDTAQSVSEQVSNTTEQTSDITVREKTTAKEDVDLINKNSKCLSNSLNMEPKAALMLSNAMYSVGVDEIDTITEVKKDEKVWKIEIVDIKQDKYCITLSPEGYLGLIHKDKFGGQPLWYSLDD